MYVSRHAEKTILDLADDYPVLAVTGPRQSGKTTLVRKVFSQKPYVSLEDPEQRRFAEEDPRRFLSQYPDGAILDEAQRCPELFSYLQSIVDEDGRMGLYVLTGSQQFWRSGRYQPKPGRARRAGSAAALLAFRASKRVPGPCRGRWTLVHGPLPAGLRSEARSCCVVWELCQHLSRTRRPQSHQRARPQLLSNFPPLMCRAHRTTLEPLGAGRRLRHHPQHRQGVDLRAGSQLLDYPAKTPPSQFQQKSHKDPQASFHGSRAGRLVARYSQPRNAGHTSAARCDLRKLGRKRTAQIALRQRQDLRPLLLAGSKRPRGGRAHRTRADPHPHRNQVRRDGHLRFLPEPRFLGKSFRRQNNSEIPRLRGSDSPVPHARRSRPLARAEQSLPRTITTPCTEPIER